MTTFPENNKTWQILNEADKGGYAVVAFNCYNADGILAAVKAAEEMHSPAMIEIFPWSLHFQGESFVRFAADITRNASVPISLHLDHCIKKEDVYYALTLPFDSIMVDASSEDPEENIKFVSEIVEIGKTRGITIEAELGRIQGGEDGIPTVDMEALYSEPEDVKTFVENTGVHYLAPSFGNIHGPYPPGGAAKYWQLDRLEKIHHVLPKNVRLVLHGVYPVDVSLIQKTISLGVRKINLNRNMHVPYLEVWGKASETSEMTGLIENGIAAFKEEAKKNLKDFGSAYKAK